MTTSMSISLPTGGKGGREKGRQGDREKSRKGKWGWALGESDRCAALQLVVEFEVRSQAAVLGVADGWGLHALSQIRMTNQSTLDEPQ